MTALYLDVLVPAAIADQLRRRGVDVLTAQEDHTAQLSDPELLARCHALGRVLFTQDIRFKALADPGRAKCGRLPAWRLAISFTAPSANMFVTWS